MSKPPLPPAGASTSTKEPSDLDILKAWDRWATDELREAAAAEAGYIKDFTPDPTLEEEDQAYVRYARSNLVERSVAPEFKKILEDVVNSRQNQSGIETTETSPRTRSSVGSVSQDFPGYVNASWAEVKREKLFEWSAEKSARTTCTALLREANVIVLKEQTKLFGSEEQALDYFYRSCAQLEKGEHENGVEYNRRLVASLASNLSAAVPPRDPDSPQPSSDAPVVSISPNALRKIAQIIIEGRKISKQHMPTDAQLGDFDASLLARERQGTPSQLSTIHRALQLKKSQPMNPAGQRSVP